MRGRFLGIISWLRLLGEGSERLGLLNAEKFEVLALTASN